MFTMKSARVNAGLSVKEVASNLGLTEDTIYNYESGKSSPNIITAIAMAKLYGRTVEEIDFSTPKGSE